MTQLPHFRYHPNPVRSGVIKERIHTCVSRKEVRSHVDVGPGCSPQTVGQVCAPGASTTAQLRQSLPRLRLNRRCETIENAGYLCWTINTCADTEVGERWLAAKLPAVTLDRFARVVHNRSMACRSIISRCRDAFRSLARRFDGL